MTRRKKTQPALVSAPSPTPTEPEPLPELGYQMTGFLSYDRYSVPPETPTLSEKGQENIFLGPLRTMRENLTESLDDLKSRLIFDDELEHLHAMRSCLQEGISWIAELLGDNDMRAETPDPATGKHVSLPVPVAAPPIQTPRETDPSVMV